MLILDAEICFDTLEVNANSLLHDLGTNIVLRPAINFGNDILFSGTIIVDKTILFLLKGKLYKVVIEMPTVEGEAFKAVQKFVEKSNLFKIQNASRVIGNGKILDYIYI